ncbi:MAG: hypothetical protein CMJ46_09505 [Planctomyces sp.]|nr:hypothetical protein [Planctomyces sp.]
MLTLRAEPNSIPMIRLVLLFLLWVVWSSAASRPLAEMILIGGVSFTLPFAIGLLERMTLSESTIVERLNRGLRLIWFPACVCLTFALTFENRPLVMILLAPFAIIILMMMVRGIVAFLNEPWSTTSFLSAMGQAYYPVAAIALYVWKLELELFDLPLGIIMLTSLHFHFAGLLLPLLLAQLSREFPSKLYDRLSILTVVSIPLVGLGIAMFPLLEWLSSLMLSLLLMFLAGRQLYIAICIGRSSRLVAGLLAVSSCAAWLSMPLAIIYACGEYQQLPRLQITTMIAWHGALNAVGFCGCGLLAWTIFDARRAKKSLDRNQRPVEG